MNGISDWTDEDWEQWKRRMKNAENVLRYLTDSDVRYLMAKLHNVATWPPEKPK